jgi:hypothetical protein
MHIPVDTPSTNPFESTDNSAPIPPTTTRSNNASARKLTSISEQSNLDDINRDSSDAATSRKASWMSYLHPKTNEGSEEKVESEGPSTWTPTTPFAMVNMYQDPKEITPVLFMVESKRQCWFQNEIDAMKREYQYYKKLIRENVQEVARVEDMLTSSYNGLLNYVKNIDDMITDTYVNEVGELLTKRDKVRLIKKRSETVSTTDSNDDDDDDDVTDMNVWLDPMTEAFSKVQLEIKSQLPSLDECVKDVSNLKHEMIARGKELEEKGNKLSLRVVEQAETNIQDAFDALMKVVDDFERSNAKARSLSITKANDVGSDGVVLREFIDETKMDEPIAVTDRWLSESQYRYACKLGLLSWKENRKDYEFWYAEIIALHEERKCRLNEVLLQFLPRRKDLLVSAHLALMSGSDALYGTRISEKKENRAIDKAIERNAVMAIKTDPSKYADITIESILHANPKSLPTKTSNYARSSTDLWKSALVRERRLVELKVNKEEWKLAVCIVTLDDCMHIFILTDDVVNDTSTNNNSASNGSKNPFESTSVVPKPLDYYTKRMSTNVSTKIPSAEFSVKLVDYDIAIANSGDSSKQQNDVIAEIEFARRARSMLFRKREDHISIRVPTRKDAMKFLRNRVPPEERLAEI